MRYRTDKKGSKRGFTLVEMLISLSIFAVVTAMAVANFRAGAQGDELRVSARLIASSIRRVQTQAVAGTSVFYCHGGADDGKVCLSGDDMECTDGSCVRDIPDAWGIRLSVNDGENRGVQIFADTNDNKRFDQGEGVRYENISSGPFVSIISINPDDAGELDLVFTPPKPKISFNALDINSIASVIIEHQHSGAQQTITVNRISGLVTSE